jgi:hypothetical protein
LVLKSVIIEGMNRLNVFPDAVNVKELGDVERAAALNLT